MSRAALAILSTEHIVHNLTQIRRRAQGCDIIAMIKANAYGHGLRSTALRLEKYVESFGVASIDEAVALRKVSIKIPITLMEGIFEQAELLVAACERFHVVFHNRTQLEWLKKSSLPCNITAWLKIDTGMGRLGFTPDEAEDAYQQLTHNRYIQQPVGIMSHLACSEEPEHPLTQKQIDTFTRFIQNKPGKKSLCNSAALFSFAGNQYDTIRPGIALYGISPFAHIRAEQLNLKPVMTLQTRLIAVKYIDKGESVGYGARFTCPESMPVGIVAMGYGDGYPRSARDGTPILVNGIRCTLVGRVSMDMIAVDLRNCPHAQVDDPVILWGDGLALEEVARFTDNCVYDILTAVQSRVKFHWTLP